MAPSLDSSSPSQCASLGLDGSPEGVPEDGQFFWPYLAHESLATFFFLTCSNPSYDLLCFHGKCLNLILGHKPYILRPNQGSRLEPPVGSPWRAICRCMFYLWWDSLIAMGFWAALLYLFNTSGPHQETLRGEDVESGTGTWPQQPFCSLSTAFAAKSVHPSPVGQAQAGASSSSSPLIDRFRGDFVS